MNRAVVIILIAVTVLPSIQCRTEGFEGAVLVVVVAFQLLVGPVEVGDMCVGVLPYPVSWNTMLYSTVQPPMIFLVEVKMICDKSSVP